MSNISSLNPERKVELKLFGWFAKRMKPLGRINKVLFNSKNEVGCEIFHVKGKVRTIPDLIIQFDNPFNREKEYMAIEVKDGLNSGNVRRGTKIYEEYLLNYIQGKTKYFIGEDEIYINHFALATQFSEEGHLIKNEVPLTTEGVRGKIHIIGKNVPLNEFSSSKEIVRGMMASYSKYRKDNKLAKIKLPSIGILVSDVLPLFEREELLIQKGMKGNPMYQAVCFNNFKKRWSQCLMKF